MQERVGLRRLLRRGSFLRLSVGALITQVGGWASLIALWGFASFRFSASPQEIAVLAFAWGFPGAILGSIPGKLVDRLGLRTILVAGQILGAVGAAGLVVSNSLIQVLVWGIVLGLSRALSLPALDASPPHLVHREELLLANSVLGASTDIAMIVGSGAASLIIALMDLRAVFVFDCVTYLAAAGTFLTVAKGVHVSHHHDGLSSRSGVMDDHRVGDGGEAVTVLFLMSLVYVGWGVFLVVEPIYVRDVLHRPPIVFAALQTAYAVAVVGTSLVLPWLLNGKATVMRLLLSTVISGMMLALYVGTPSLVWAFAGIVGWGIGNAIALVYSRTILHERLPLGRQARVLSLNRALYSAMNLLSLPLSGILAGASSVQAVGVGTGVLTVALASVTVGRSLRLDKRHE